MRYLLALALLAIAPVAACLAAPFSADGISIEIPSGFEGPVTERQGAATIHAFVKPSTTARMRTLLQLTAFDTKKSFPPLTQGEMWKVTDKYLRDVLKGVERRRAQFSKGTIAHISLGGAPASKIAWTGRVGDLPTNGIMYCVIVGSEIVSLHTQDAGTVITASMAQAVHAIESLTISRGD